MYGITEAMDMSLSKLWELVDGQGGLACCGPWGCKESDTTDRLNQTELMSSRSSEKSLGLPSFHSPI